MMLLRLMLFSALLTAQPMFDVILRGGRIADGTGRPIVSGDVAVRRGFIAAVGQLPAGAKATLEIDARGLIIAPGFINIHSHAREDAVATASNMLLQGVTTEIINADGFGVPSIRAQLQRFAAHGLAVNLGAAAGLGYAWASVMGMGDRRPTAEEIAKMREMIAANLREGAWAVSAGLDYKPSYYAKTEEVIAVLEAARPFRTNFPNHDRVTPESKFSSLAGHAETMEIAAKAGLLPVITHAKVQGWEQGKGREAVQRMRAAGAATDVYPYLAGQTALFALIIPAWAQAGGRQAMLERFSNREQRMRIVAEAEAAIAARFLKPENILLPATGKKLTDFMREFGAGAGETVLRLLEESSPSAIMTFGAEADLVELLRYENTAVSCDCGAALDGPGMHPRYFGTFPRVLGHYVREAKALTLEDAVRKMSGLPAALIGMTDRGLLAPGMAADIAVFDPVRIADHATYAEPLLPSTGMRFVLVNGRVAVKDGKVVPGVTAGKTLFRGNDEISRLGPRLGRLQWDAFEGVKPDAIGLVQVAGKWASFTAMLPDGAVRVVIDGQKMTVYYEDGRRIERVVQP